MTENFAKKCCRDTLHGHYVEHIGDFDVKMAKQKPTSI